MKNIDKNYYTTQQKEWYKFPITFWELVDKLDWPNRCNESLDYLREDFQYLCNHNKYVMDYFNKTRRAYVEALKTAFYDYDFKTNLTRCSQEIYKGGDDGFDDLMNHIVGHGKELTLTCLRNPEAVRPYLDSVVESFAYIFHY